MADADQAVEIDMVSECRILTPHGEPDFLILRVSTLDGKTHNFGFTREGLTHTVRVWAFDLGALESTLKSGSPHPGKPVGSRDRGRA